MANPWDQDPPEDSVKNPWDADPPSDTAVATAQSVPTFGYLTEAPPTHPYARIGNWLTEFLKGTFHDSSVPITNPQAEMPGYVAGKQTMDVARETSPYILAGTMTGGAAAPYLMSGTVGGIGAGAAIEGLSQGAANVFNQVLNQTDNPLSMINDIGMGAAFSGVPATIAKRVGPKAAKIIDEILSSPAMTAPPASRIATSEELQQLSDVKLPVNMIDNAPPVTYAPDAPPAPVSPAKQPWEMTKNEYLKTKPVVAIKGPKGELYVGRPGDIHATLYERIPEEVQRTLHSANSGWVDSSGKFFTRYSNRRVGFADAKKANESAFSSHKEIIGRALSEGKPVPPEVLADYPDLKPAVSPAKQPTVETPKRPKPFTVSKQGMDAIEQAKQEGRDAINAEYASPRDRADAIERSRNYIEYVEAREMANHRGKGQPFETYRNGDKIGYTGEYNDKGEHTFIYLEGPNKGKYGITLTPPGGESPFVARNLKEHEEMQAGFRRLRESGLSDQMPKSKTAVSPQGAGDVTLGAFGGIDDATLRDIAQKGKALAKETPAPDAGTAIETFGRPAQNFERGWGERVYNNFSKGFGKIVPDFLKNPNKRITLEQSKALLQSIPDAQSEADLLKNAWDSEWSAVRKQSGDLTAEAVASGNAPAVKAFTDQLFQSAVDAGIPLNKLQNYLTRQMKSVIGDRMQADFISLRRTLGKASETGELTDKAVETALAKTSNDTQEAIKYLVDTKQAGSVKQAYDILGSRFEEDLSQTYGVKRLYKTPFEKARGSKLPDRYYETNVNTLMRDYISKMSKRVTAAQKFGVNGEKVTAALNKIGQYDQAEQKFISNVFDLYTGKYQLEHGLSGGSQKVQRAVTNTIIAGKIGTGLSTIANSLQTTISSIPQVGYWRAIRGGVGLLSKSGRAYARAIAGDYRGFEEALGGFQDKAFTSKLTHLLTEGTGFNGTNYMNLILGSSMYKPYVEDLYKIAQGRGARALWAKSNLADLGIDVAQKLDDDVLARAVHTLTFDSQLMEKVSTSPFYLNSPRLRWLTSLKKFSVNQFIRNKDLVGKELSRGNVMPFLRLAAAGVAGGEAIIWAKNQIKSALPGNPPQYRKEDAMWERVANDVAASGTLGMFTDVFSAKDPSELINKMSQAVTPAPVSIGLAAKDEAKIVAKRAETVGIGPAMRKEAGDIASVIGGAYAGGAANAIFQTPGDVKENLTYRRTQEKAAINDLFVQGKNEAAQKRIALWNKNNPEYGFKGKEFTNKGIKKIIKKRAEKKYEAEQ